MARAIVAIAAGLICALLLPATAAAQVSSSGIAGVVRDTSGAVLPGVTVEASSPALIEKVRSVVTDEQGQYKIVDLRIGTYVVTFSLPGFANIRREGVELTTGFTATINADMQVGALEETITVTGASPLVDTQNTRKQTVLSSELLDVLPSTSKGMQMLVTLVPGMIGTPDVGGSSGSFALQNNNSGAGFGQGGLHGKPGSKTLFDGMRINNTDAGGNAGYIINALAVEEMTVEMSGSSAESNHGVVMNSIPKQGSNTFRGSVSGLYNNGDMQSNNLDDALRARGLTTAQKLLLNRDFGVTAGGPIKRDKLWFFTAHRWWGQERQVAGIYHNLTQGTPFYTPDFTRPSSVREPYRSNVVRLTWQVSPTNKVNLHADNEDGHNPWAPENKAPEAQPWMRYYPNGVYQATWSSPQTNRLLFEAGASYVPAPYTNVQRDGVTPDDIGIIELSTGLAYNAGTGNHPAAGGSGTAGGDRYVERASMSYVTGSHAFKVGFQNEQTPREVFGKVNRDIVYRFNRGAPSNITQYAYPNNAKQFMKANLGIYAQDQWTVQRLTLNLGVRFEYLNAYVPEQHLSAGQFVPARDFEPVHNVPNWTDLNPRVGAAYDLFGNGKTAVKVALGRFMTIIETQIAEASNPVNSSVNSVTRTWNDVNRDYVPDCDLTILTANGECAQVSNLNFGKPNITTRYSKDVLEGFGVRPHTWDFSTEVQHELGPGVSMSAGYYRNWFGNFGVGDRDHGAVIDNLEVTPADYSPYCITAPVDARLPGGGGYQVCGLYDISLEKFGKVNNLITRASDYGKPTQVSNFFNVTLNMRLPSGVRLGGGVDTGRIAYDNCFVVDSPQQLVNCHVVRGWYPNLQMKAFGSYPLPGAFVVSAVFQHENAEGRYTTLANYAASNAEIAPSLGRNLAACGTRAVCTATAIVPLIVPETRNEGRRNQLDVRLTKFLNLSSRIRVQANLDVYNALNANTVLQNNANYGAAWLRPINTLAGRVFQVGGQVTF